MDIIVAGLGEKKFKPDEITLNFDFKTVEKTYEEALEKGVANVDSYLNLLTSMGFKKEEVKTRSFRVSEERHYDDNTRKYIIDGFSYTQNAKLVFDYDMKKLSKLMEETSKANNPPIYRINFNIKDERLAQEELLSLAYENALFQANAIAKASGTKIICCKKTSFQPFEGGESYSYSPSVCDGAVMAKAKCCSNSTRDTIQNIFVPEDVSLDVAIFCQFLAE